MAYVRENPSILWPLHSIKGTLYSHTCFPLRRLPFSPVTGHSTLSWCSQPTHLQWDWRTNVPDDKWGSEGGVAEAQQYPDISWAQTYQLLPKGQPKRVNRKEHIWGSCHLSLPVWSGPGGLGNSTQLPTSLAEPRTSQWSIKSSASTRCITATLQQHLASWCLTEPILFSLWLVSKCHLGNLCSRSGINSFSYSWYRLRQLDHTKTTTLFVFPIS
jgi:hypothetical protein